MALIEDMVGAGILNRADDAIPTRDELLGQPAARARPAAAAAGRPARPHQDVGRGDDPGDGLPGQRRRVGRCSDAYFPKRLREVFAQHFGEHYLRREIVGTAAVNHIVNNAGVALPGARRWPPPRPAWARW